MWTTTLLGQRVPLAWMTFAPAHRQCVLVIPIALMAFALKVALAASVA